MKNSQVWAVIGVAIAAFLELERGATMVHGEPMANLWGAFGRQELMRRRTLWQWRAGRSWPKLYRPRWGR
ncbi:MAG: hypothetical protein HY664_02690 [Chloroflexi bacterium]|nr:hypothetical protein [Chloroflexota bacterium]